jgi:hypothetical protein
MKDKLSERTRLKQIEAEHAEHMHAVGLVLGFRPHICGGGFCWISFRDCSK